MMGKRECPVARTAETTSDAVASVGSTAMRVRSVIRSMAVSASKSREFLSRRAVDGSRVPASAERRTSAASSWRERPPASSSRGSMPNRRRIAPAMPLSTRIRGFSTVLNAMVTGDANRATLPGSLSAMFLGTSSPKSMENTLMRTSEVAAATVPTAARLSAVSSSGTRRIAVSAGWAVYPSRMADTVMPTWAPHSWVDRVRRARETRRPWRVEASTRDGSRAT